MHHLDPCDTVFKVPVSLAHPEEAAAADPDVDDVAGYSAMDSDSPPHAGSIGEYDSGTGAILEAVAPYTMTSSERIAALVNAIRYVTKFSIPGAVVECGVWRGGSMMAAALELEETGELRPLYLFDTYEGMSRPDDVDVDRWGRSAREIMANEDRSTGQTWAVAGLEEVRRNVLSTAYPADLVHFVQGQVEETIPEQAPDTIALLRLDTDFYESTRHELEHLVPRVSQNGVLIIDDYGHWEGARRAVDEWLAGLERPVLLNRIDYTGRIAVLP